jgi:methionine-rich copper-binding protein CopC
MLRIALAVLVALLLGGAPAWSASMQVMESLPAAHAVMDGTQTEFFVRFDGPVDHNASRFQIVRDGVVVQTLRPRLSSQPNVLYSGVRRLEPGSYVLHWNTRSMRDQEAAAGDIEFTVR